MIGIFPRKGVLRQATRMKKLKQTLKKKYVITDFICPYEKGRQILKPDILIWMDTTQKTRFKKKSLKEFFKNQQIMMLKLPLKIVIFGQELFWKNQRL